MALHIVKQIFKVFLCTQGTSCNGYNIKNNILVKNKNKESTTKKKLKYKIYIKIRT